jgi:cleavage and polyadenylation specificity factor subunit 3
MLTDAKIDSSKTHNHHHHGSSLANIPERSPHAHITPDQRLARILMFLEAQFGDCVELLEPPAPEDSEIDNSYALATKDSFSPGVKITIDQHVATVAFDTLEVKGTNEALKGRVRAVMERAVETVAPFVDSAGFYA